MATSQSSEGERKRKKQNNDSVPPRRSEKEAEGEEYEKEEKLLPNMSNDITLKAICGRVPWEAFQNLSLVSPAWHRAIRSGRIFAARADSHSAEKFALLNHTVSDGMFGLSVVSTGDRPKCRERLPPIPLIQSGIPQSCECLALDGKLYILGGLQDQTTQLASENVYMLNLQGAVRQWRECAPMLSPRQKFRAGVINGKIYVCGGSSRNAPVCGTEVYDPEADAWTALMPMPLARTGHDTAIVHDELFVYGGSVFDPNFPANPPEQYSTYPASHIEVYNPVHDAWRQVHLDAPGEPSEQSSDFSKPDHGRSPMLIMPHGKLLSMTRTSIFAFDFDTCTWSRLFSISSRFGVSSPSIDPNSIRAMQLVDNQILVICGPWYQISMVEQVRFLRLKMQGIGGPPEAEVGRKPVFWERIDFDLSVEGLFSPFIRVLLL